MFVLNRRSRDKRSDHTAASCSAALIWTLRSWWTLSRRCRSAAQYLYLQFPLIIGFWERSHRSATQAATPPPQSLRLFSWDSAIHSQIPRVLQMNPAVTPNAEKKPAATEANPSLNAASHLWGSARCFLYFWGLIRLKRYSSYYIYRNVFFFTSKWSPGRGGKIIHQDPFW